MNYRKLAKTVIFVIGVISLAAIYPISQLKFNYEFESFFPVEDPELEFYNEFREKFMPDNDFVLIGLQNKQGIFDTAFLKQVESLTDTLKTVDKVLRVASPTDVSQLIMGPFGPIEAPYLHPHQPEKLEKDSIRIYQAEHLIGSFFSTDAQAVSITIQTEPGLSKAQSDSLVVVLDDIYATYTFDEMHVSGRINGQKYYVDKMKFDLSIFVTSSFVLLVIFLWFTYRSLWGIWVPIVVVVLAILWLLATMSLLGRSLDLMSVLLPTILFVVGMSDVVHILTRYLEELRNGLTKVEAVKVAFKHIGVATLLTSVTTSIGFLTLLTANIVPVKQFGVNTAIGVFLAFLLAFSLLPAILILFKRPEIAKTNNEKLFWNKKMHALYLFTIKNRKRLVLASGALILLALLGISNIQVNNYLLEDLSEDDPHRKDFEFFEEKFAGVRPFDMAVWVKDSTKTLFDADVQQELMKLENYLVEHYEIGFVTSPLMFTKTIQQTMNGGNPKAYRIPTHEKDFKKVQSILERFKQRKEFQALVTENLKEGRISAKVNDYGGNKMKRLNIAAEKEIPTLIDTDLIGYRQTGMAMLIDKNNESLAENMMYGLLIAFGVIAIIMGALFRSVKMVVITLIPNILPLLLIGGFMGLVGIDLKVSTSIIFTIAFGIAVDDTIHYMSKLRLELNKGKSMLYALKRSSISTGKAITVTSLILCSGFVTLILSDFTSTFYIGLLVSMTLLFAVFADLVLLPALIITFYGNKSKAKKALKAKEKKVLS